MTGRRIAIRAGASLFLIAMALKAHGIPSPPEAATKTGGKSRASRIPASAVLAAAPQGNRAFHILLDPGHGGKDKGATRGALKESEIALRVAMRLADLLREDPRFRVSLTRTADEKLTLRQRTDFAQSAKPDLFLSIHLNSSNDPRAQGKEFYFQNQLPVDEESMFLASRENDSEEGGATEIDEASTTKMDLSPKSDLKRILEDLNRNERIYLSSELSQILLKSWVESNPDRKSGSRAIRQAPFHVVSNVTVPSVLVELGFITHAAEGPRLAQKDYQEELAQSLYNGLVKYKETVDKDGG